MDDITKKKPNRGFTLVEVLVAAAILSLVVAPILSSFVTIARVNAKSRMRLSATTIANGVMESVKAFDLSDVALQCNGVSAFHVVAGGGTATEYGDTKSVSGGAFTEKSSGEYEFRITNISMDGTKYAVRLVYSRNDTVTANNLGIKDSDDNDIMTRKVLGKISVRALTYYDVTIQVYRNDANFTGTPLAQITGSKADYTPYEDEEE